MKIYSFDYCSDSYESCAYSMGLFSTKKAAFKAMNKYLNDMFWANRNHWLSCEKGALRSMRKKYGGKADIFEWKDHLYSYWEIREMEVDVPVIYESLWK